MKRPFLFPAAIFLGFFALISARPLQAQKDPGPRPGPAGAGSYYPTLNANEQAAFANGISPVCGKRRSARCSTRNWKWWIGARL